MFTAKTRQISSCATGKMSVVKTGQMSAVETELMSAADTGQMSAGETTNTSIFLVGSALASCFTSDSVLFQQHICPVPQQTWWPDDTKRELSGQPLLGGWVGEWVGKRLHIHASTDSCTPMCVHPSIHRSPCPCIHPSMYHYVHASIQP